MPAAVRTDNPPRYHSSQTTTSPQALRNACNSNHKNNCTLRVEPIHLPRSLGHPEEQPYSCAYSHSSPPAQHLNQKTHPRASCHFEASGERSSM